MRLTHRSRATRGFTIVEMMVSIGIVAMLAAIAIPWFQKTARRNRLASASRDLVGHLHQMRAEASTGRVINLGPPLQKTRYAGIQILSDHSYRLFTDQDALAGSGNEVFVRTVDFDVIHVDNKVLITAPAIGTEVRFRNDGSTVASVTVTLRDASISQERSVQVNGVGHVRMGDNTFN